MQTNLAQLSITISDSKKYALHSISKAAFASFSTRKFSNSSNLCIFFPGKRKDEKRNVNVEHEWDTARSPWCNRCSIPIPFTFLSPFYLPSSDGSGARSGDGLIGGSRVAARKRWFVQPEATFTPVVGFVTVDATRDTRPR